MQCSKCKREFGSGEEVMVEGKGKYSMISGAVLVTDQTATFCIPCDEASYKEEAAGREEAQPNSPESNPGDAVEEGGLDPVDMEVVDPYKL